MFLKKTIFYVYIIFTMALFVAYFSCTFVKNSENVNSSLVSMSNLLDQ